MIEEKDTDLKEFLDLNEVAEYLGVHISTIYRYIHSKTNPLPAVQISKAKIIVRKSELDSWLEEYKKLDKSI